MDEVIMVSDDSDDTEAFYPGANYGDGREEEEEEEFPTSEGEAESSSMGTSPRIPATHTLLDFAEACGVPDAESRGDATSQRHPHQPRIASTTTRITPATTTLTDSVDPHALDTAHRTVIPRDDGQGSRTTPSRDNPNRRRTVRGPGAIPEADRSPYDVAAQSEGEAAKGSEGLTTPPRRVSTTPATLSQGVQTSQTSEDHPQEVSDQGTQTSPPNRQDLHRLTQTPEMRVPYDEGPTSPRRDVGVSTPIVSCSEYLAGFELVTDTKDDEEERPLLIGGRTYRS